MSEAHVEPKNLRLTLATLALGGVAFALLQSLVAPALPEIQRSLHTTESAVSWVLTAYLLSAAVATPIGGRLGDMFGKERMLLIVLSALAAGTLLAALATSIGVLVAARSSRWRSGSSATSSRASASPGASGSSRRCSASAAASAWCWPG
jgi:predicted MFS family arabinose efflux permease